MPVKTIRHDFQPIFISAAILLLGLGLRFYQLDRTLGGGDENQYLLDYADTSLKYIATTYFFGGHPVFHTLLMRLMIMGFDDETAIAIRFPAFIAGIASLLLIYRVALQLFNSFVIARLSLLIAVLCPIHIYYSQTARGYSLIMFFSIAMVYAAIKLMDSPQGGRWGMLLALCGALSVYTVPTNVYFAASLAGWLCVALLVPRYAEELKETGVSPGKKALFFLAIFLLMALLSYLVYLPLVDQVIAESRNYHLAHEQETSKLMIAGRVPIDALKLIFPSPLMWFLPLLAVGVLFGDTVRPSYRLLPVCIFFLPLIVPLLTGVSGYARNYLYNLPILVIFLAAGIVRVGKLLNQRGIGMGIAIIYTLASLKIVFLEHYPAIKVPDGKLYKQMVRKNSNPLDLIAITDTRNYLYAIRVYKDNVKNIIRQNQMAGVKVIALNPAQVNDLVLPDGRFRFPIFRGIFNSDSLKYKDLAQGKKIFSLSQGEAISVLPEDLEAKENLAAVSGAGRFSEESRHKLAGNHSLLLEGGGREDFVVSAVVPKKIRVMKDSFIVFLWSGKIVRGSEKSPIYLPAIMFRDEGREEGGQLRLGKVNDGTRTRIRAQSVSGMPDEWLADSFIGVLPPGEYAAKIMMKVLPAQSVLYDGLRLFVIEMADTEG